MKKSFLLLPVVVFIAMILTASMQAQIVNSSIKVDQAALIASLKFSDVDKDEDKAALEILEVKRPRIFRDYTRNYPNARGIKVSERSKSIFIWASIDGIKTRVEYKKKGRWQNTLKYYDQERLSAGIKELVKQSNPYWKISAVVEIQVGNKTAYVITINNVSEWKTLRVVNGEIEVYNPF